MKHMNPHDRALVLDILSRSMDLTLASMRQDGTPHATTVSFANAELVLYAAIGIDSQKAHDIRDQPRVALTINAPYRDWSEIQGMSIDAVAEFITDAQDVRDASDLLLSRFPQYARLLPDTETLPWPGMLFIRIVPHAISLLDYTKGFGHTTHI